MFMNRLIFEGYDFVVEKSRVSISRYRCTHPTVAQDIREGDICLLNHLHTC